MAIANFKFENSFAQLPNKFYQLIRPTPVPRPQLIRLNSKLAAALGYDLSACDSAELAQIFSGNKILDSSEPLAMAYAGHQFGHFVPQLGDGRAILLGEIIAKNGLRYDVQLKGSGQTKFSRRGDGRAALGPVMREYIVSEAMEALKVPTTRALAFVTTGEVIRREEELPGAILTRIALSHMRVGTFEYFAVQNDVEAIRQLADYAIQRHYPQCQKDKNPYPAFYRAVVTSQAQLIAKWMHVGFIHGVMNTDNTAISGETIDYGPCAFMDQYDPATKYSSIDHQGRYAYGNQPNIAHWNLQHLGVCLLPLFSQDKGEAIKFIEETLSFFEQEFVFNWQQGMLCKIGLPSGQQQDIELLQDLLELMQKDAVDFTLCFRRLADMVARKKSEFCGTEFCQLFKSQESIEGWLVRWRLRLTDFGLDSEDIVQSMNQVNPAIIARNHQVEKAIESAVTRGDFSPMDELVEALRQPFEATTITEKYTHPPRPQEVVAQTFCGT